MALFRRFCEKLFSGCFRLLLIVKEQRAVQCITVATLASSFFSAWLLTTRAQPKPADLILVNGDIRTLDPENPRAEALAVTDGKITVVGTTAQARRLAGERTRVIDAQGRLVLPGFNDSHVHFAAIGNKFSTIDLRTARTPDEVAARLAEYARFLPRGRWILGSGLNEEAANDGRLRALVDAVTPVNPVFVYAPGGTSALANSRSLEIAGLTARSDYGTLIPGRGRNGLLTGDELKLVASRGPKDHLRNWPEILETASNYAASLGVTSVQDMHSDELADVYRELDRRGKLKTRVYDCSPPSALSRLAAAGIKAASGDAMVRTGCVKLFAEGNEAEIPQLRRDVLAADRAGLQVMVHAMGPRANRNALDALAAAAKANGPRDRRSRVEHAHNPSDPDLLRFTRSGIIASMQPWLFHGDGPEILGRHRRLGTRLAFGSDASMVELDPLLGIFAAARGNGALSIEQAVRAYTYGSAFAEFQEKVKGTIATGKVADIVILSDNVFARGLSPERKVAVHVTIVDGKVVYEFDRPKGIAPNSLGPVRFRDLGSRPGCQREVDIAFEPQGRSYGLNACGLFGAERR